MGIEYEQLEDGRWIAIVPGFTGILALGASQEEVMAKLRVSSFLAGIRKRPGLYWGGSDYPFTSLVAFISGHDITCMDGRGADRLVPHDFHRWVTKRYCHSYPHGGAGWMTFIEENTSSEEEVFQLFFQLREEYDRSPPDGETPPPSKHFF